VREQMAVMADYSLPAMTRRLARAFRFTVASMAMNDAGPRIVGALVAVPSRRGRRGVAIEAMFVDPPAQGMGVGAALVEELVAGAALRGMARISVAASLTALGFYRRCGFEPVGAGVSNAGVQTIDMWRDLA
jgi:GNAT superfamily N-acetyltransferase